MSNEQRQAIADALIKARAHIKRTPRVCDDIYLGSDSRSYGTKSKALVRELDGVIAALATPSTDAGEGA